MMETVVMIACSNKNCKNTERPEGMIQDYEYLPPYGWLTLDGGFFGSGPDISIVVCSLKCVTPAIQQELDDQEDEL